MIIKQRKKKEQQQIDDDNDDDEEEQQKEKKRQQTTNQYINNEQSVPYAPFTSVFVTPKFCLCKHKRYLPKQYDHVQQGWRTNTFKCPPHLHEFLCILSRKRRNTLRFFWLFVKNKKRLYLKCVSVCVCFFLYRTYYKIRELVLMSEFVVHMYLRVGSN